MRATASIVFLAFAGACQDSDRASLVMSSGDVVVVVEVRDGHVSGASASSGGAIEYARRQDGPSLLAFHFARDDLIGPTGAALDAATIGAIHARSSSAEPAAGTGACGRCLAYGTTPQVIHPGDSCPLPEGSELVVLDPGAGEERVSAELAARIRHEVRLDFPGTCPCARPGSPVEKHVDYEIELLAPLDPGASLPPETAVASTDGTVMVFGTGFAIRTDGRDGSRTERRGKDLPVPGPAHSAIALSDGSLVVAGSDPERHGDEMVRLSRVDRSFAPLGELVIPSASRGSAVALDGNSFVFLGRSLFECSAPPNEPGLHCEEPMFTQLNNAFNGLVELEDGSLIALHENGTFAAARRPAAGARRAWTRIDPASVWSSSGVELGGQPGFDALWRLGSRVFVCVAEALTDPSRDVATVFTASISSADGVVGSVWRRVPGMPEVDSCGRFLSLPDHPGRVLMLTSRRSREVVFDEAGRFVTEGPPRSDCSRRSPYLPGLDAERLDHVFSQGGFTLAIADDGAVYRRDDRPGPADHHFERMLGPSRYEPWTSGAAAAIALEDRTVLFGERGRVWVVPPGGGASELAPLPGFIEGDQVTGAARDHLRSTPERDAFLVAGYHSPYTPCRDDQRTLGDLEPWLRRVGLPRQLDRPGAAEVEAVPPDSTWFVPGSKIVDLEELAAGRWLILTGSGVVLDATSEHDGSVSFRERRIDWDDRATGGVEGAPVTTSEEECRFRRPLDEAPFDEDTPYRPPLERWRSVDVPRTPGAGGVALITGCRGAAFRVPMFGAADTPLSRVPGSSLDALDFTTAGVWCPDHALLAAPGASGRGRSALVESRPPPETIHDPGANLATRLEELIRPERYFGIFEGSPLEIAMGPVGPILVATNRTDFVIRALAANQRVRLAVGLHSAAIDARGDVIAGARNGRIFRVTIRERE